MELLHAVFTDTTPILAAGILDSSIGTPIKAILKSVAIILVLFGVFKAVKSILEGKAAGAVKTLVWVLIVAAIMWDPTILTTLLDGIQSLVETVFNGVGELWS